MPKHKSTQLSAGRSGVHTGSIKTSQSALEKPPVSRRPALLALSGCILVLAAVLLRLRAGDRESQLRSMQTDELVAVSHLNPDDAVAHLMLAERLLYEKRVMAAKNEYDTAIRLAPSSASSHLGLGRVLVILNQRQEAEEQFIQALKLDPGRVDAERALGALMATEGRNKEALPRLAHCTEREPDVAENWYQLGLCQNTLNLPNEAIASLERAIKLKENSAEYHTALGEALNHANQGEAALREYERALQIDPNYGEACAQAGSFLTQNTQSTSDTKRAEEILIRATTRSTKRPAEVWFDLGQLYVQTGRQDLAVNALLQSIQLEPRDERFFYALANAYRRQNKTDKAAKAEKQFHRISALHLTMDRQLAMLTHNPDDAACHLGLARTYRDLGLIPQAVQQYSIVLRLMPSNMAAKQEMDALTKQATQASANATANLNASGMGNANPNR